MTEAHRVYQNDDIFRVLARHCDKPSLVQLMRLERHGTIFDSCVKELYKGVAYDVVKDMTRETRRQRQYLDAVIHIKADLPPRSDVWTSFQPNHLPDHAEPCSPTAVSALRLKCPNLRRITRHQNGRSGQRFTINIEKNQDAGTVQFHDQIDLVPVNYGGIVRTPTFATPSLWQGWNLELTAGLGVVRLIGVTQLWDDDMKAVFMDTDHLDKHVTELQTGWLRFTLSELSTIIASRYPNKAPISRINATVEPFHDGHLSHFMKMSGKDLYQLHLYTQPHSNLLSPKALNLVVGMVRMYCPNLVQLRLPMTFSSGGVDVDDSDIEPPSYNLTSGPGTIQKLTLMVYEFGGSAPDLGKVFSLNFARNLACLLAPDFELFIVLGPFTNHLFASYDQGGIILYNFYRWYDELKAAIKFFQNLGPILEPHFAAENLDRLGILSFDYLRDVRYKTSGEPHQVVPTSIWSRGKKRTWEDYFYGDDPRYLEDLFLEEQAEIKLLQELADEEDEREQAWYGSQEHAEQLEQEQIDADKEKQAELDLLKELADEEDEREQAWYGSQEHAEQLEQEQIDADEQADRDAYDEQEYQDQLDDCESDDESDFDDSYQDRDAHDDWLEKCEQEERDAYDEYLWQCEQEYQDHLDECEQEYGDSFDNHNEEDTYEEYLMQCEQDYQYHFEQCELEYWYEMERQEQEYMDAFDYYVLQCDREYQDHLERCEQEYMDAVDEAELEAIDAADDLMERNALETSGGSLA